MQATDPAPAPPRASATLADWLRLAHAPGVGPLAVRTLLARCGTPTAVFAAGRSGLRDLLPPRLVTAILAPPSAASAALTAQALAWCAEPGHTLLTLDDPAYPAALRQIADPPPLLYVAGRAALLATAGLAIVGSRNATAQGQRNAAAFAQAVSACGVPVVSGLALGIDAAAHAGALRGPGATVAVLGTGVDVVYPAAHAALARAIAGAGCLVSEFPLGTPPRPGHFPRRNRIISGLATAVLVVEAAARSGSLITAHVALDQGRDVLAVPGSIHAALSKGCHALIKEGATLVDSAADILQALGHGPLVPPAPQEAGPSGPQAALLAALDGCNADAYAIAAATGYAPGFVIGQLLTLELEGWIERLPGGMFQKIVAGP